MLTFFVAVPNIENLFKKLSSLLALKLNNPANILSSWSPQAGARDIDTPAFRPGSRVKLPKIRTAPPLRARYVHLRYGSLLLAPPNALLSDRIHKRRLLT